MLKIFRNKLRKLTLFDRIIILLVLAGIIFFAYAFFRKATYVNVTIKVGEEGITYQPWRLGAGSKKWFAELFRAGMKESDGLGRVGAEVISVYSYNNSETTRAIYLTINLRAVYDRATKQYTFKGLPLSIGSKVNLNLDNLLVDGLVTHIQGVNDPRKKVRLVIETKIVEENPIFPETTGTSENVAKAINIGDEVKDSLGNAVIKITNKRVENAKRLVTGNSGDLLVRNHPLRYDVYLTLDVLANEIAGSYFLFDDIPLSIGKKMPINTKFLSITPEILTITLQTN